MNVKRFMLFWFLRNFANLSSDCDFYQQIDADTGVSLRSTDYPSGINCRYIIDCPYGHNCRLECSNIYLPQFYKPSSCIMDKLLVSQTGDTMLRDAVEYCGSKSLSVMSTDQRISIGFITSPNNAGGRFQCEVTAHKCLCGFSRQNRIVNGYKTTVNDYPMMAGIIDMRIVAIQCGGVIISNWFVLTAAHCLTNLVLEKTTVIVGEHDTLKRLRNRKVHRISNFYIHPQYSTEADYDIAIIKVSEALQFSESVSAVCLPFYYQSENFFIDEVTALGWGTTSMGGPKSPVLLQVKLKVMNYIQCMQQNLVVTNKQMCTYTPGRDTCQYDSGGPLLYMDPTTKLFFNVGIISNGNLCASLFPSTSTKVTTFLDWIVNTTRVNFCKVGL